MSDPDPLTSALERFLAADGELPRSPGFLRLVRKNPDLAGRFAGLPDGPPADDLEDRLRWAHARWEAGQPVDVAFASRLEAEAQGHPRAWVPAVRLHVGVSETRERRARAELSDQDLPYVPPGELHPLAVEVLGAGERVLTALHHDWLRRLTGWVAEALLADAAACGFWFWPVLRSLDDRALSGPLRKTAWIRRGAPGAAGMAVAYRGRLGLPIATDFARLSTTEAAVAAIALLSDRRGAGGGLSPEPLRENPSERDPQG